MGWARRTGSSSFLVVTRTCHPPALGSQPPPFRYRRLQAEAERSRADDLEVRHKALAAEADEISREAAVLRERLGRGDYDPTRTRVLHLALNPEREAKEAQQRQREAELLAENEALRGQLQRLDEALRALQQQQQHPQQPGRFSATAEGMMTPALSRQQQQQQPLMTPLPTPGGLEMAMLEAKVGGSRVPLTRACRPVQQNPCRLHMPGHQGGAPAQGHGEAGAAASRGI